MSYPKFIIETDDDFGDCLIIGKCTYHKHLATNRDMVKGGGWFTLKDDTFTFRGRSEDFGTAKLEDIKKCIENDNVFMSYVLSDSIASEYKFLYNTETELIPLN